MKRSKDKAIDDLLLSEIGARLVSTSPLKLEWSLTLSEEGVIDRKRMICWIEQTGDSPFASLAELLEELSAPLSVREAQARLASQSITQGFGASLTHGVTEYRLYIQHGDGVGIDQYDAFRWIDATTCETARYEPFFLPESPSGIRPIDVVHPRLEEFLEALLLHERLQQTGAFWLRTSKAGFDQLNLVWVWLPPVEELRTAFLNLSDSLGIPADWIDAYRHYHFRHTTLACRPASKPTVNIYFSAPMRGKWPGTYDEMKEQVQTESEALHLKIEREIFDRLPRGSAVTHRNLDAFYSTEQVHVWQQVLGPLMHYHHGIFKNGRSLLAGDQRCDQAFDQAVFDLFPFIPAGATVYDIGCGWGGPAVLLSREHGCQITGLTISKTQYQYCASIGLRVRYGDVEATLPPGFFDCMLFIESFEHVYEKLRLLQTLRLFGTRLVMRVNCQDESPESVSFAGTMHLISSSRLRELIEAAGWRIVHWRNRRPEAMPSIQVWHERLQAIPIGNDLHLETFRGWTDRVLNVAEQWAACNPLIEVMAD